MFVEYPITTRKSSIIADTQGRTFLRLANQLSHNGAATVFHKLERPHHGNQVAKGAKPFVGG